MLETMVKEPRTRLRDQECMVELPGALHIINNLSIHRQEKGDVHTGLRIDGADPGD